MLFSGRANFISNRVVKGVKDPSKIYYYAKFSTEDGGESELQCDLPVNVSRFADCKIVVDIIQGKYPRYNLVSCEIAK